MKVKFTTTANGEMAIIPRSEYERLVGLARDAEEDLGTSRLVTRAKMEVAKGFPLLPKAVVDRLADGENPIKVLREYREQPQTELAVRVGIKQNYLSEIESGKRKGPFELHQKIARALGVPLELLAPIAVSLEEADPERFARRRQVVAAAKAKRNRR